MTRGIYVKEDVIVIVGPTAVGKTDLSIALAKKSNRINIISGDSVQVYRHLNIGSGKVTEEEAQGIPHAMIDILNPDEDFSVADFQAAVRKEMKIIHERGNIPLIVGGSGLYIQAILYDYQFTDKRRNEALTLELEKRASREGHMALYEELQQIDEEQAAKIHPNNVRRVIRALESYYDTGSKMSEKPNANQTSLYNHHIIGLTMERTKLYEKINARVDQMIEYGLVDEVRSLYEQYGKDVQSMRAIGYKEIVSYIEGEMDLPTAIDLLKRNSRRFAKRQFTWFENKLDVNWYMVDECKKNELQDMVFQDLLLSLKI